MQKSFDGRELLVGKVLTTTTAYTRYFVTYKSGPFTVSGIMNVPKGEGPFPVIVLNHGFIDPSVYVNGQGLRREQDYLARNGYVVIHTDYRNHASSDNDPDYELHLRLGYTEDTINAVVAARNSGLPYIDPERIGMLGRSMGGGVSFNAAVVAPELVDAFVVYAPISSDAADNFNRWVRRNSDVSNAIISNFGSPEENPDFWAGLSAVNFFDRVERPIQIHHGTSDDSVPYEWSERTFGALQSSGKQVELLTYEGEEHAFTFDWTKSIERTAAFFDAHIGSVDGH